MMVQQFKEIMMKAIVTGSFDPFTLGHLEIVRYATYKYDTVYVVALNNENAALNALKNEKNALEKELADLKDNLVQAESGNDGIKAEIAAKENEIRSFETAISNKIIEKYGLYTYDDFADYVTYEDFGAVGDGKAPKSS